jgi:ubiquinone/menaquinone biosynthesis C-methylase UbiE
MSETAKESWGSSGLYEQYVGRWSRKVAPEFLQSLGLPHGAAWADVGCGTGVLAECILATNDPRSVTAIDKS